MQIITDLKACQTLTEVEELWRSLDVFQGKEPEWDSDTLPYYNYFMDRIWEILFKMEKKKWEQ